MDLLQIENIITTQLRVRVPKILDNQFPNMTFTNEMNDKVAAFPNVYVHELEPTELANDLENKSIHAIRSTIQIIVSANTTKTDARKVSNACITAFKHLRYSATMLPIYQKDNNIHRFIFRVRRTIASGDTFN